MTEKPYGIEVRGFEKFERWYATKEERDRHLEDLKKSYATSSVKPITK